MATTIGVMLRALGQKGGVGIYTEKLIDHLLEIDRRNKYVLYYAGPGFVGRYADDPKVREQVLRAPNRAIWDQFAVPRAAKRDKVDVLFHTKFTVPLLTRRKTVMSIHGASWFVIPEVYKRLDVMYIRAVMPLYCRRADAIVSNSQLTTDDYVRILGVPETKIKTVLLAPDDAFKKITDRAKLNATREEYGLPERFMLSVVKYDPRKNVPNLLESFRICRERTECKLVVVGLGCEKYREECALAEKGIEDDVIFLGWVANERLPALYSLAEFLFFPSVYEEFGIPTVEAMACGTPVVVSKTGALPELAGDAGILVDPSDPSDMANAIWRVWTDDVFRAEMAERALRRARAFSWEKCARQTLALLEEVAAASRTAPRSVP